MPRGTTPQTFSRPWPHPHFFPLRPDTPDFAYDVDGAQEVMQAYRVAQNNCEFFGEQNFSPTIEHYRQRAQSFPRDGSRYQASCFMINAQFLDPSIKGAFDHH
jgi:hypothetical protein